MAKGKKQYKFYVFLLAMFLLSCVFLGVSSHIAFADEDVNTYTNVLEDLQKAENFNIEDFPIIEDDYSLKVIQIAESVNNELFIYVYSPAVSKDFKATCISISTTLNVNSNFNLYDLQFLNSNGVFQKYKVKNFELKKDVVRYYDISEIFRKWDENIDAPSGNDNIIEEVSFPVAKLWTTCTLNGDVYYNCTETNVVTITGKWCGFKRYENDWYYVNKGSDRWFVAFSTDYKIDNLVEADIYYTYRTYSSNALVEAAIEEDYDKYVSGRKYDQVVPISQNVTIRGEEVVSTSGGLFKKKYKWNRIETVDEFKKENKKFVGNPNIEGLDWVLSFVETKYTEKGNASVTRRIYGTQIENVSILRLKFESDGIVYNLGVVDNKQSADTIPDFSKKIPLKWWHYLLMGFGTIIFFILIFSLILNPIGFISTICKIFGFAWKLLKLIVKVLWYFFTAPFSLFFD